MKVINWENKDAIKVALEVIDRGGILVYPTDTIYGFGVNAKNPAAIDKLNIMKNRTGPISVIAPDKETVSTWIRIEDEEKINAVEQFFLKFI